jgi:pentose-5-phosphate-3-epimerase
MTVYPGFSGQRLIENVIPKIYKLAEIREKLGLGFVITADGGVNWENIYKIGPIDEAVMGSAFFMKKYGMGNTPTP